MAGQTTEFTLPLWLEGGKWVHLTSSRLPEKPSMQ